MQFGRLSFRIYSKKGQNVEKSYHYTIRKAIVSTNNKYMVVLFQRVLSVNFFGWQCFGKSLF